MSGATPTLGSLRRDYERGRRPAEVVDEVYARIASRGEDHVWTSLVPVDEALAAATALDPADRDRFPLWGVPYALKDNIDAAGLPTTAACPGFAYTPGESATVVSRLRAAGAILVGKTNLDQFATGLNGTRSPYGAPASVADPDLISGGSSSGSAVAVAAGIVPFSLGTDTAGSGRVPASLNGVVGLKPTIGLVSTRGVVPACASLDCVSVFAHRVSDAARVLRVIAGRDPLDPRSRTLPVPGAVAPVRLAGVRLAVPERIGDWGERGEQEAWLAALARLTEAGVRLTPIATDDLFAAGDELYDGAWVAERVAGIGDFLARAPDQVLPVIRDVLASGERVSGAAVFAAQARLAELTRRVHGRLSDVDALLAPTVTRTFTRQEMGVNPIALNSRLGRWTTFTNLLDLCALALPVAASGAPFGVTLHAPAGRDAALLGVATALEELLAGEDPPTGAAWTDGESEGGESAGGESAGGELDVAVVGAHLEGQPLHHEVVACGATLVRRTITSDHYRLYALDLSPPKPGLRRAGSGGRPIEVEVYRFPIESVGRFLAGVAHPLALGQVELADGSWVHGFVCEPGALSGARDISEYGGWRAWLVADMAR